MPQQPNQVTDFQLNEWLSEIAADGSLNPEEVKSLGTILGKDVVQSKLRDQFLMRKDYSRKTQDLADQKRQVEQDVNDILAERADLAVWKKGIDDQVKKVYADLDAERSTVAQFDARMRTIAEQNGLDVNELTQGLRTARAATGTAVTAAAANGGNGNGGNGTGGQSSFDATKFVPADEFSRFARQSPMLYAEIEDIFAEHQELTGKPLKVTYKDSSGKEWTGRRALLVKTSEHNQRSGNKPMSVRDMWESDFDIPKVRQTQLESSIENRVREKLDAEYKTRLSEQMINGGTPGRSNQSLDGRKSVLFDDKRDQRLPAEREASAASGNGDNGNNTPPPTSAAHKEQRWEKSARGFLDRRAQGVPLGQDAPVKAGL